MSQYDYGTIDPNAKSGTQLAVDLNNWRDALHSCHRGGARPLYAQAGMLWVRETSSEQWDLMLYDGDTDFVLRSVNPTTNQLIGIPQSAVSGLSEIATTTAELEGKAVDLEVRAGELETLAGELESGFADLEGGFQDLNSQIDFTIIYPNGGSAASPANVSVNSRYVETNPFPGFAVICQAEILVGGRWYETGWYSERVSTSQSWGVRACADGTELVVQVGSAAITTAGRYSGGTFPGSDIGDPTPCRVKVWKVKGAIA